VALLLYLAAGVVVFGGGWLWAAFAMFDRQVLLPVAYPLAVMSIALGTGLAGQWIVLTVETRRLSERARQIEAILGQSVSHAVLQAVKADPEVLRQTRVLQGTVLFCDLREFTRMARELAPEAIAALLNEYFTRTTKAIFDYDGFIDKFIGDEVMAVFSVPVVQADHARRAVLAAVAIKRELAALNRERVGRGEQALVCGIGIHTGPLAAGHVGTAARANYTVVGHTVNVAARIEGFTQRGEILISSNVCQELPPSIPVRFWRRTPIRGCVEPFDLYEVPDESM
jgi:adenylate cyclase